MNNTTMRLFLSFLLTIAFIGAEAQPLEPLAKFNAGVSGYGFYLLTPYYIKRSMPPDSIRSKQLILDGQGKLLMYRNAKFGSDFKLHKNGKYSFWEKGNFIIMNEKFKVIDSVRCSGGMETDPHEFKILPNGNYLLLGKEKKVEEVGTKIFVPKLKSYCSKKAVVKYDIIQELDQNKKLVFQWNLRQYYKPEDVDPFYLNDTLNIDLTHCNTIDIDKEGNLIVSVRNYNEIVKINRKTGNIIWRMGGKQNNIKFINDSIPFFGQHFPVYTETGTLMLFDNGLNKDSLTHSVRALEYKINDKAKTAELIWSYSPKERIVSEGNGNAIRLDNKKTLISYGKIQKGIPNTTFNVIDSSGNELLNVSFADTMGTYRTQFYPTGVKIVLGKIALSEVAGEKTLSVKQACKSVYWNTGEKGFSIKPKLPGIYYAFVSADGKVFVRTNEIKIN